MYLTHSLLTFIHEYDLIDSETRVVVQFADAENSNVALENVGTGEWLTIYGTQDVVQMWKDQIDECIKNRAALNVRLTKPHWQSLI